MYIVTDYKLTPHRAWCTLGSQPPGCLVDIRGTTSECAMLMLWLRCLLGTCSAIERNLYSEHSWLSNTVDRDMYLTPQHWTESYSTSTGCDPWESLNLRYPTEITCLRAPRVTCNCTASSSWTFTRNIGSSIPLLSREAKYSYTSSSVCYNCHAIAWNCPCACLFSTQAEFEAEAEAFVSHNFSARCNEDY